MKLDAHPKGAAIATHEQEAVQVMFDAIHRFHSNQTARLGPGLALYAPENSPRLGFLAIRDMGEAPQSLKDAVQELMESVPDSNYLPVAFTYSSGVMATYVVTGAYGDAELVVDIVEQRFYKLDNDKPVRLEPGAVHPWEMDL
jgi:hypothetical protein